MTRALALLASATALAALLAQALVSWRLLGPSASLPALIWVMSGYFTILTNALVALLLGWSGVTARPPPQILAAGLTLSIVMVGLVYHAILARLWAPAGLAWWADQGLHTAVPLLVALWWLVTPKRGLSWRGLPLWLIWPALYSAYALIRGAATGWYPYPFLDAAALGPTRTAASIAAMLAAFALLGSAMIALARAFPVGTNRNPGRSQSL